MFSFPHSRLPQFRGILSFSLSAVHSEANPLNSNVSLCNTHSHHTKEVLTLHFLHRVISICFLDILLESWLLLCFAVFFFQLAISFIIYLSLSFYFLFKKVLPSITLDALYSGFDFFLHPSNADHNHFIEYPSQLLGPSWSWLEYLWWWETHFSVVPVYFMVVLHFHKYQCWTESKIFSGHIGYLILFQQEHVRHLEIDTTFFNSSFPGSCY